LPALAPASGHLVHMPAHIYERTGNYSGAAKANENAAAVDRKFIAKNGGEGIYALMYYNHNLQFGTASYMMNGNFEGAKRLGDEFGTNAANVAKQMQMIEAAAATPLLVRLRFAKWADVISAPIAASGPMSTSLSHFARGVAFAKMGDVAAAERERDEFEAARKTLGDDYGVYQNSPKAVANVASGVLDGRIAEAKGDRAQAIRAYQRAVEAEDALDYDEPADWFYPVRETLGAALLRDSRYAEAEQVFRDDLKRNPNNPRSLFGLTAALKAQKKNATSTAAEFKKNWRGGKLTIDEM
jgi:tetratricopeptide (TPR) repeat protein